MQDNQFFKPNEEELRNLYWEKGLSIRQIGKLVGRSKEIVVRWMKRYGIPRRPVGDRPDHVNLSYSPELAYVFGVCKGDGSVHADLKRKSYYISLGCMDKDFADEFRRCLEKIIEKRIKVYLCSNGQYLVRIRSKMLYEFLKNNPMQLAEMFPREFVRGLADSEGSACLVRKRMKLGRTYIYPKVSISNNNVGLLLEVKKRLMGLGIEARVYLSKEGKGTRKTNYELDIAKRDFVLKFSKLIGFSINRKREVFENYFQTVKTEAIVMPLVQSLAQNDHNL
jgi:intein-encoded DNA endonuclease-like protein